MFVHHKNKMYIMVSIRLEIEKEDMDFITEHKMAKGVTIQEFIRSAIKHYMEKVEFDEDLENLNKLK